MLKPYKSLADIDYNNFQANKKLHKHIQAKSNPKLRFSYA